MIEKDKVKKIAVIKLCCFGDITMITPVIKNLKYNFPNAEIVLISSDWVRNIINLIPSIDRYIIFNPFFIDNYFLFKKIISALRLIKILRKENFDLAFLAHRTSYLGAILFLAGVKYRLGFSTTKFINYKAPYKEELHETKKYLEILLNSNLKVKYEKPELIKPKLYDTKKEKLTIGIYPFGGVNPGTVMEIKRWGLDNYIQLINLISKNYDTDIIIWEGKTEGEKLPKLKLPENVLIKEIDNNTISLCNILIGGDTGTLHIAAAMGISTLGIFGPTNPEYFSPINYRDANDNCLHIYIWKRIECSPCYTPTTAIDRNNKKYWIGNNFICYKGTNECIKSITVEEVFSELKKIVEFLRLKA